MLGEGGRVDDRHELHRRNQTAHRMTPADQRFRAAEAAVGEVNLRLVEQLEFTPLDSQRKFGFQRNPCFELLPHRIVEHHVAAAPRPLGAAEGQMAVAQKLLGVPATFGINGNTGADLDAVFARPARSGWSKASMMRSANSPDGIAQGRQRHRNGELVAAQTRH